MASVRYNVIATDGTGFTSEDICGGNGLQEFCDDVSDLMLSVM